MKREAWKLRLRLRREEYERKAKEKDKRCYWQGRSYLDQYRESLK